MAVWLYIAGLSKPDRGLPRGPYALLLVLRLAAMLFVVSQVWRVARSRGPAAEGDQEGEIEEHDGQLDDQGGEPDEQGHEAEEQGDEVDPLAGPMAGAPDRVLVHFA